MPRSDQATPNMALFCDFENVALGVRDSRYDAFDITRVLERLLLKGSIVVKKAYCDWDRYKEYKAGMHQASFEMIEIPHTRMSGKNSADIRMVVDALDLCYTKSHVDCFVIISGDSDFSPLVSKLRENAKTVIGVGVKNSTSDLLIANCDEFIFYDDLVRDSKRRSATRARAGGERGAAERGAGERGAGERSPGNDKGGRAEKDRDDKPASPRAVEAATTPAKKTGSTTARRTRGAKAAAAPNAEPGTGTGTTTGTSTTAATGDLPSPADALPVLELPADLAPSGSDAVPPSTDIDTVDSEARLQRGLDLVVETLDALVAERGEDDRIWGSMIKQTLKRRNPGFNEGYYGFKSFNRMLEVARDRQLLALEIDEKSGGYVVRAI